MQERLTEIEVFSDISSLPLYARGAVILLGSFDGLHRGHQTLIEMGRSIADRLQRRLAVFSVEPHPREFFGRHTGPFRLVTPEGKVELLAAYGVEIVFAPRFDAEMAGLTPEAFVVNMLGEKLAAVHVVIGTDYRFGKGRAGDAGTLVSLAADIGCGTTVVSKLQETEADISSTRLRDLVREGRIEQVRALLGHHWAIRFSDSFTFTVDEWGRHWAMANIRAVLTPVKGRYDVLLRGRTADGEAIEALGSITFHPADAESMERCVAVDLAPVGLQDLATSEVLLGMQVGSAIVRTRL